MKTLRDIQTMDLVQTSPGLGKSTAFRGADYSSCLSLACLSLSCLSLSLLACNNPQPSAPAQVLEAVAVAPSTVAANSRLYPTSLTVERGAVSDKPLSVLTVQDQAGTTDTWDNYLELSPGPADLQATFTFTVPESVSPEAMKNLTLIGNYKGQAQAEQTWTFQLYDYAKARWVTIGDNQAAPDWSWTTLAFAPLASARNFVSATKKLSLRVSTPTPVDSCDLDYLALSYTTDDAAPMVPAPAPAAPAIWTPAPGTSWQIQFVGALDTSVSVKAFDLDLFATPKTTIDLLHARGTRVICYFSGGSSETYRPDFKSFPSSVKGKTLSDYPDERWLDVRQLSILGPIMTARMDLAVQKGCDAVDVDNMDGYTNDSGFAISYAQQLAYNNLLATEAHRRGLSIGLKNDLLQIKDLADSYDFAINEQCLDYNECNYMKPFIDRQKAVFAISYSGTRSSVCTPANSLNFDMLIKNLSLDAARTSCR